MGSSRDSSLRIPRNFLICGIVWVLKAMSMRHLRATANATGPDTSCTIITTPLPPPRLFLPQRLLRCLPQTNPTQRLTHPLTHRPSPTAHRQSTTGTIVSHSCTTVAAPMRQYHDCCRRETCAQKSSLVAVFRLLRDVTMIPVHTVMTMIRVCSVRFGDLLLLRLLCFGAYLLLLRLFLHKALY